MKRSTPLSRHIGGKVRFYRKKRGMTQEELAARLQNHPGHGGPYRNRLPHGLGL